MLSRSLAALTAVVLLASPVLAETFIHQHVRIEYASGSKLVGEVIDEQEDAVTVKLGKLGQRTIDRSEINQIVSIEKLWLELQDKQKNAKSGEDWWTVSLTLEKEGFDK